MDNKYNSNNQPRLFYCFKNYHFVKILFEPYGKPKSHLKCLNLKLTISPIV